jgi:hypothetical protein
MSTAEKLADCANLTTTVPLAGPAPMAVTFAIDVCGPFRLGEQAAVPAAEAAALVQAGFATYA